jgi:hypothetical protein
MKAITEARRHLDDAKGFLRNNANNENGLYKSKKYVKMAGHTAYTGILLALDELLGEKKTTPAMSVEWYQKELSGLDKKITSDFVTAYQILHLDMGYGGTRSAQIAQLGVETAENILNWVESRLSKPKR